MTGLWAEVITAIVSIGLGVLAFIQATRASRSAVNVEQLKIDADAYGRAQEIYDRTIEQLRTDNARLITQIAQLEAKLESQLGRCERRINQLEQVLINAGVRIPPVFLDKP